MSMHRALHHPLNNPILGKVFWFFCYLIVLWSMIVIIVVDAPDFKVGRRMIICPIIEIISSILTDGRDSILTRILKEEKNYIESIFSDIT